MNEEEVANFNENDEKQKSFLFRKISPKISMPVVLLGGAIAISVCLYFVKTGLYKSTSETITLKKAESTTTESVPTTDSNVKSAPTTSTEQPICSNPTLSDRFYSCTFDVNTAKKINIVAKYDYVSSTYGYYNYYELKTSCTNSADCKSSVPHYGVNNPDSVSNYYINTVEVLKPTKVTISVTAEASYEQCSKIQCWELGKFSFKRFDTERKDEYTISPVYEKQFATPQ